MSLPTNDIRRSDPHRLNVWQQLRTFAEALIVAFLVVTFVFNTVGIAGDSMTPTLHDGERAFVPKYQTWLHRLGVGHYSRGDVVYFRPPENVPDTTMRLFGFEFKRFFIKRIVALPGEHIRVERGTVFVDGEPLEEPYLDATRFPSRETIDEIRVPEGFYFVMGDNRGPYGSLDSRRFGPIPESTIAGEATFVMWPPVRQTVAGGLEWNLRWIGP